MSKVHKFHYFVKKGNWYSGTTFNSYASLHTSLKPKDNITFDLAEPSTNITATNATGTVTSLTSFVRVIEWN